MRTTLLVLLLVVCFLSRLGHGKRKRCRAGLRMGPSGCSKPGGSTLGNDGWMSTHGYGVLENMERALGNRLGREVLIPCTDSSPFVYCEVCFKDDPSRISCPTSDQSQRTNAYTPRCPNWQGDYSYWSGYDDGTICDCGSPFVMEVFWSPDRADKPKLRRPMQGEDGFLGVTWAVSNVGMNAKNGVRDFPALWGEQNPDSEEEWARLTE